MLVLQLEEAALDGVHALEGDRGQARSGVGAGGGGGGGDGGEGKDEGKDESEGERR